MNSIWAPLAVPIGLGLLGFAEPCSIGTSLLFLQYLEGRSAVTQVLQTLAFTATRALFIGSLGALAALVGGAFVGFQKAAWLALGAVYVALGIAYFAGHADRLKRSIGPSLARIPAARGAMAFGLIFGLNVPACAAPLLAVVMGNAALSGPSRAGRGFVMLAAFGLALSAPIAAAVLSRHGRRILDALGRQSSRAPKALGIVFVALGIWSAWFALFAAA